MAVPARWTPPDGSEPIHTPFAEDNGVRIVPVPTAGREPNGAPAAWRSGALRRLLMDFRPDIVQVEEDPSLRVSAAVHPPGPPARHSRRGLHEREPAPEATRSWRGSAAAGPSPAPRASSGRNAVAAGLVRLEYPGLAVDLDSAARPAGAARARGRAPPTARHRIRGTPGAGKGARRPAPGLRAALRRLDAHRRGHRTRPGRARGARGATRRRLPRDLARRHPARGTHHPLAAPRLPGRALPHHRPMGRDLPDPGARGDGLRRHRRHQRLRRPAGNGRAARAWCSGRITRTA